MIHTGNSSLSAPVIHNKAPLMLFFTHGMREFIPCNVTGTPRPRISWYKLEINAKQGEVNSYRIPRYDPSLHFTSHEEGAGGALEFYWVDEERDVGIYTCMATNKYGSDVMYKYVCIGSK